MSIPVLFAKGKAAELLRDSIVTNCTVGAEVIKVTKDAYNVCGYIDNGAATTVVIGAHYDHLGYGHEGSLYRGEPAIHNGADDNASGTAALIELGRDRASAGRSTTTTCYWPFRRRKGPARFELLREAPDGGSHEGELHAEHGHGRSPEKGRAGADPERHGHESALENAGRFDRNGPGRDQGDGIGCGAERSYVVLSAEYSGAALFSGTHADYHKPSDDEDKINYPGALTIIGMIRKTIALADGSGKLVFTKTKDESNEDAPKFKVTLGVVPDYAFDGEGMRIDGVSDGKPAQKAGLLAGDVVVQIGDYKVVDMMSYMKALGKFTKGETTTVKVKRGAEMLEKSITF
ncbi:M28 family peptidase [Candidatus Pollutiaquabacter sp.]|uniref:M28 family peptidase n=1 Tax=Candidatus Pollutiaquabacter sp. TaxID=3416354 RepID=UPI003D0D4A06